MVRQRRKQFIKKVFVENATIKIFAFLLAIIMFLYVKQNTDKEVDIEIPVAISDMPDDLVFTGELPQSLRLRLKGRWSKLIEAIEMRHKPFLLNLVGFKDDSVYIFDKDEILKQLGLRGINILAIQPSSVTLSFESKIRKSLPVRLNIIGVPPEGYEINRHNIKFSPKEIFVSGAKSSLKEINEIFTAPIDITGLERDFITEIAIQKSTARFVNYEEEKVKVEIPVAAKIIEQIFKKVKMAIRNCDEEFKCSVEPKIFTVKITGPEPELKKFAKENIAEVVYINAEDRPAGRHNNIEPVVERREHFQYKIQPPVFTLIVQPVEKGAKKQ